MKKIFLYIAITLGLLSCNHKDSLWQEVVEDLDERVETLEMLCAEMNTNITSLQTIVDVLQSNDFITSIVEIKKEGKVVGYTITFGKHDPITIYHGQDGKDGQNGTNGKDGQDGADGKDGQNGADGKDGLTPVIGVAQDTDGVYYWTLNGEWLLDDKGNKLPVSGKDGKDGVNGTDGKDGQNGTNGSNGQDGTDGKDGQDGEDGKDGADGQDGKDGVTPQLKIEEGYWFISYDNGATWTQLGKATGEDGKDGADGQDGKDGQNGTDGKDGQDGDSMFQSVTQDENYVYFTLADGTVIKIAKKTTNTNQSNGFYNNREYIDLGLPSGTKWAKENLNGIYCFGGLYSNILPTDTIYINGKPIEAGDSICGTQYDVATYEWGEGWLLPTENDFRELMDNCTMQFSEEGMRLISNINKKTILFPYSSIPQPEIPNITYDTHIWRGVYGSATAYKGLNMEMSRYYRAAKAGYTQSHKLTIDDIDKSSFLYIRPVYK